MKNLVVITEIYEGEIPITFGADYDKLPVRMKNKVDLVLKRKDKSVAVNVYEDGLQSLSREETNDCRILPGEQVTFMGSVSFYEQ